MIRLLLVAIVGSSSATAQTPARVAPFGPPEGAVVGPRPLFEVEYSGIEDERLRDARFRIVLSRDGVLSEAYRFDQRERRTGWIPGEAGRMVYRPPYRLEDGAYAWRVAFWNGVRWVEGPQTARLRVDTVPPAEVGGLNVVLDRGGDEVVLSWDPVVFDQEGQPEYVAHYRVLRYESGPPWPVARVFEVGQTQDPVWIERLSSDDDAGLVVYRVIAEDEAGNVESGRR